MGELRYAHPRLRAVLWGLNQLGFTGDELLGPDGSIAHLNGSFDAGLAGEAHGAGAEHAHAHARAGAAEDLQAETDRAELVMSVLISTVVAIINKILQMLLEWLVVKERPSQVARRWRR